MEQNSRLTLQASKDDQLGTGRVVLSRGAWWRFLTFLALCLTAHLVLVLALLLYDLAHVPPPAEPDATEVELIEEPAPEEMPAPEAPKQEAEKQEEKQPTQALEEEPATAAPRVADHEIRNDRVAPDKTQTATTAPQVASQPSPPPAPAAAPEQSPRAPEPEAKVRPEEKPREAEVIENAAEPAPAVAPEPLPVPPAKAPVPVPPRPKSVADQIAGLTPLPDLQFEAAAKPSTLAPGTAKPTYLSTLYGMIMPLMHAPRAATSAFEQQGAVGFTIDGRGRLVEASVIQSSGAADLDNAALAAVRMAGPFPVPPMGVPIRVRFAYTRK